MNVLVSILKLISRLPLGFLYLFSDFFFLLNHYIIGYRKKVVLENLRNSFPEKSDKELKQIEKKFFKNFFADGGKYMKFVNITNDGAVAAEDRIKMDKQYKIGVVVSVNVAGLRKDLEDAGMVRGLNSGF